MSIQDLLEEIARRGSWVGGGSVAALGAAASAALLEKLVATEAARRPLRRGRRQAVRVIQEDARVFARVIAATRRSNPQAFRTALQRATALQVSVLNVARDVQQKGRAVRRTIPPKFQSDLRCALALARAAETSAQGFIRANRVWLQRTG
jgi:formiminotetrahydrofolate cyclodeaminase